MFTKMCGMGGVFDKNSFILGMKYSFLKNTCSPLQPACSELNTEEPSSRDKLSFQKQFSLGSDSRKAANKRLPDISTCYSISNSTAIRPWKISLLFLKINIFCFHRTRQIEPFMLHCFEYLSEANFINFYLDIRRILQRQVCSST